MSNRSPGSQTIAFIPNALTPSGPLSCCQRPYSVGFTGCWVRSTSGIVSPWMSWSTDGAPDDDSPAHRESLNAQVVDAGVAPPAQNLIERMCPPEALDARPQEASRLIPAAARHQPGGRQADPRPSPPCRIPCSLRHAELQRRDRAAG